MTMALSWCRVADGGDVLVHSLHPVDVGQASFSATTLHPKLSQHRLELDSIMAQQSPSP